MVHLVQLRLESDKIMLETLYHLISQYILLPLTLFVFPVDYQIEAMIFLQTTIKILAIIVPVLITVAYFTYAERKVIGFIQGRIGPNRVGRFGFRLWGLGQPIADAVKLMVKEIVIPLNANRTLFVITSILVLTGLTLQAAEYIDIPIIIIPSSVLYIIWLFILMKNKN